jgi:hypothetical protein
MMTADATIRGTSLCDCKFHISRMRLNGGNHALTLASAAALICTGERFAVNAWGLAFKWMSEPIGRFWPLKPAPR